MAKGFKCKEDLGTAFDCFVDMRLKSQTVINQDTQYFELVDSISWGMESKLLPGTTKYSSSAYLR